MCHLSRAIGFWLWCILASGFTHFYDIICYFHWHFQVYALGAGEYENHLLNMPCIINVNAELFFKKRLGNYPFYFYLIVTCTITWNGKWALLSVSMSNMSHFIWHNYLLIFINATHLLVQIKYITGYLSLDRSSSYNVTTFSFKVQLSCFSFYL